AMDGEGRIYVTDSYILHYAVYVYDKSDGAYLGDVYDVGYPLRSPIGIALSSSNKLYIASLGTAQIEVYGLADMTVNPLALLFEGMANGGSPASQFISIENSGTQVLDWTAGSDDNWIVLPYVSGSTASSSADTLEIGIDLSGLLPGTYYGEVAVTAGSGAQEIVDVTLDVLDGPSADPGGPYIGMEGQSLLLDGSGSGGNPSLYEWDVDNNGTYDYSSVSPTQSYTYGQNGIYTVVLRITAEGNITDTAQTTAEITDSVPSPDFTGAPLSGASPLTVGFTNYSTGYDQPLQFAWDFDNNGVTDSTEVAPGHTYPAPGTYTVKLTVTDADGSTNSLTRNDYVLVSSSGTCQNDPIKIKDTALYFLFIQDAYDAASGGDVIQSQAEQFTEDLMINMNKSVALQGGYSCEYIPGSGMTTIRGSVTISAGSVSMENFIIE
ncbi:MAG: PKD domain-containing protein, partial [Nitrospiraceae bacterium]